MQKLLKKRSRNIALYLLAFLVLIGGSGVGALLLNTHLSLNSLVSDILPTRVREMIFDKCEERFDKGGLGKLETVKCGIYADMGDSYRLVGKFLGTYVDRDNLARANILLYFPQGNLKTYNFVLGKLNTSYTFITLQREKTLFHRQNNYKKFQKRVDNRLLDDLNQFKGQIVVFSVVKGRDILNLDPFSFDYDYREDIEFRKSYFFRCRDYLQKELNLAEVESKCGFVYINGITFFKDFKNNDLAL